MLGTVPVPTIEFSVEEAWVTVGTRELTDRNSLLWWLVLRNDCLTDVVRAVEAEEY